MRPRTSAVILTLLLLATLPIALLPAAAQPTPEQQAADIEECDSRCLIDSDHQDCAISVSGSVMCWNRFIEDAPVVIEMPGGEVVVSIAVGSGHACAILSGGETACWGVNNYGQLGNNQTDSTNPGTPWYTRTPVYVDFPEGRTATAITAGQDHSCAIMDNGSAMCWGWNDMGEMGVGWHGRWAEGDRPEECDDPDQMDQYDCDEMGGIPLPTPVATPDGRTVTSISAAAWRTCLTLDNGFMMCAGVPPSNAEIEETGGMGSLFRVLLPDEATNNAATATSVSVSMNSACVLVWTPIPPPPEADVYCWGQAANNGNFQHTSESGKVSLPNGTSALEISTGGFGACAMLVSSNQLLSGGGLPQGDRRDTLQIVCWGDNRPLEEIAVPEGRAVTSIATGNEHNCLTLDNGSAMCWSTNKYSGDSNVPTIFDTPALLKNCDYDEDGVPDSLDAFPTDAWEWSDTDSDGVGDNADDDDDGDGEPDASDWAPLDPSETSDSDADGVGDNADILPNDSSQSTDSDGDGYGDNVNGTDGDAFPWDPDEWADADGDDWGDNADQYPNDPYNGEEGERESVSERSGLAQGVPGFGFMAALSALLLVAVFRSGRD